MRCKGVAKSVAKALHVAYSQVKSVAKRPSHYSGRDCNALMGRFLLQREKGRKMVKKAQAADVELAPADQWESIGEALKPLDRLAREMELKWGAGRLPGLVDAELAHKFGSAKDKLNEAIQCNNPDMLLRRVEVMLRGWQKLDDVAMANGADKLPLSMLGYTHGGRSYVVVMEPQDYDMARQAAPAGATVVAMAELIESYKIVAGRITGVLEAFPGAQIKGARAPSKLDDDIPF